MTKAEKTRICPKCKRLVGARGFHVHVLHCKDEVDLISDTGDKMKNNRNSNEKDKDIDSVVPERSEDGEEPLSIREEITALKEHIDELEEVLNERMKDKKGEDGEAEIIENPVEPVVTDNEELNECDSCHYDKIYGHPAYCPNCGVKFEE